MALQLTLSCDLDKSQSGPTLIHSTGIQDYKIPPEVIRTLQENISSDGLSDHEQGVLCQDGPQRILDVLRRNGFTLQKQTTDTSRALWTLVQNGGGSNSGGGGGGGGGQHPVQPPAPHPTPSDGDDADAGGEDQGDTNEEGGGEEEGGEDEEEEEEEEEK